MVLCEIQVITIDAYPDRVKWYEKRGFKRNLHKHYEGKRNVSMRFDLFLKKT